MAKTQPQPKPFGEQLADARRDHGMSQEELGQAVGAAGRTVSTWETGVHVPTKRVQATVEVLYGWPRGTIGHAIRTGADLPPVTRSFEPRSAQVEGSDDERVRALRGVNDALEHLVDRVAALEDRVRQLESSRARTGQRAQRAR